MSAAIAAAGAVQAKREQLAYTASLVIVFALPSIFLLPAAAGLLGLDQAVAGARVGGNIDTTAAVSAAGAIVGEQALQIATIVKTTQNALLGVVAVALTAYFAFAVERRADATRPGVRALWERFGEVRARLPGRVDHRHAVRHRRRVGHRQAGHRHGQRPAHAVVDPGLRLDRSGVPGGAAAARPGGVRSACSPGRPR